ncbi:MAG TPA: DUF805 domain-containing protein [Rhizomicrobium sp.]|jgi:uncharacterized membrane protein YhaH (DUF805 family)|nr:DUF805 domain-containing protein [Rhizomicrobium sp.]
MEAINWFQTVVTKHYVDFQGRARRAEYWWYTLVYIVIYVILAIIQNILGTGAILTGILSLALLLPSLGVSFRRMHDIDRSAWWLLLAFIPLIGAIILIYWFAQPGTAGSNQFGSDPKAGAAA